eukprot:TRINITY_DN5849_c0_g1_i1.p1 TRINITY_DN5849_c0_g1~~TRINITY_DN5849_c0_g1_i1.p1  ORF type:complete len:222 (+),score=16.39 TRINITY_DN5849_c0_g1_i1:1703-2368(+)
MALRLTRVTAEDGLDLSAGNHTLEVSREDVSSLACTGTANLDLEKRTDESPGGLRLLRRSRSLEAVRHCQRLVSSGALQLNVATAEDSLDLRLFTSERKCTFLKQALKQRACLRSLRYDRGPRATIAPQYLPASVRLPTRRKCHWRAGLRAEAAALPQDVCQPARIKSMFKLRCGTRSAPCGAPLLLVSPPRAGSNLIACGSECAFVYSVHGKRSGAPYST